MLSESAVPEKSGASVAAYFDGPQLAQLDEMVEACGLEPKHVKEDSSRKRTGRGTLIRKLVALAHAQWRTEQAAAVAAAEAEAKAKAEAEAAAAASKAKGK